MNIYKEDELHFSFPKSLIWQELDEKGATLPEGLKLVDLVIERENDILLVEIKDPSCSTIPAEHRPVLDKYLLSGNLLKHELTPKARDSYTFLHLMELADKPLKYIILLGLDAYELELNPALLLTFKDKLVGCVLCETKTPWKRLYIADYIILSLETWNKTFADWPVTRIAPAAANEGAPA